MTSRRPSVVVLDYGSGNLRSAQRALQRAGADAEISADADAALRADGLVVPGVGAFAACMSGLREAGGDQVIVTRLAASRPVLGICVGMQILFAAGDEHGVKTEGVGCWPGVVQKLTAPVLPHMGWNVVSRPPASRLLAGIDPNAMFYFVHSYAARQAPPATPGAADPPAVGWTTHGEPFVALVEDGPLMATQFHPEKSSDAGALLLANWLEVLR
ncbi:MAG TPA: imidazole glycerol phosphate synthase subunit HisH [Streptosporangiaceae bacterium]|nr:imidazole glycerol phosphate synthase subunit HisH [Streptosporangiaceae bacterium]